MPEDIQRRETVGGNAEIAGRREVGNPGLDRIVDGAIEGTLGVAGLGHQLAILIDAEHADVVDNDLNMLGLQVFDGLRIRAQEVRSILRFHARRLEDDRGAGRDGMNDLGHGAAFIMPAVGNCFAGGQVDDVARARQEPVFDVGLCRSRVDGVFLPPSRD